MDKYTIQDVANLHGIKVNRISNGEFFCDCPVCGNKNNKFSYIVSKGGKQNMFHCWSCDIGGSATDLHILLSPENYCGDKKRAAKDIFNALQKNTNLASYKPLPAPAKNEENTVERKSTEYCSLVYYRLLSYLPLRDEHKADLLKRGLSETEIKRFKFKSMPKDTKGICRKLINDGFSLEGVPGFFMSDDEKWTLRTYGPGYLCPVFDGRSNLLLGFQIRIDNPKNGKNKYMWFSSCNKKMGTSSGSISTYLPGSGPVCIITEGILKATVIYCLLGGIATVIGVPGVKSIKSLHNYLEDATTFDMVLEAYDMDKAIKTDDPKLRKKTEQIKKDTKKLHDLVASYGREIKGIKWDADKSGFWKSNYKGLDDYLAANEENKNKLKSYIARICNGKKIPA